MYRNTVIYTNRTINIGNRPINPKIILLTGIPYEYQLSEASFCFSYYRILT